MSEEKSEREEIEKKLNELKKEREARAKFLGEYLSKRDKILEDVQSRLDALGKKYIPTFIEIQKKLNELELRIKALSLKEGQAIRIDGLMTVFAKGRESVDAEFVELCEALHPEIALYRSTGLPSISIKEIK
jgi:DNA repair exonuclease SbcCD ATPase subunit